MNSVLAEYIRYRLCCICSSVNFITQNLRSATEELFLQSIVTSMVDKNTYTDYRRQTHHYWLVRVFFLIVTKVMDIYHSFCPILI